MNIADTPMLVLAATEPQGPEFGKASPLGLLVILLLLVATAFLIWSMNRQLKKLPRTFDAAHPEADQAFDEGTDTRGSETSGTATDVEPNVETNTVETNKVGMDKAKPFPEKGNDERRSAEH